MADSNSLMYDVTNGASTNTVTSKNNAGGSDLGKDAFLQLLVTQLQYQDPLNPMDNTQFVSQMAQFTSLEQMQNLNSTMTNSQAYGMIGRTIYAQVYNETTNQYEDVTGSVDSVTIKLNKAYLNVGDKEVPYDDVKEVYSVDTNTSIDRNLVVSQALSLVGKSIQAITLDDDLNAKEFIEGTVDYVKFVDDTPVLSIGGKDVYTHEVVSVSDNTLLKGQNITAEILNKEGKEYITISGPVSGVSIDGDSVYLIVDGNKVEIKDVGSVLKSIAYVGKDINATYEVNNVKEHVSGTVESVMIKDAVCYLVVGDKKVPIYL